MTGGNKYKATKIVLNDGTKFDSKKEYERWLYLKQLERDGEITDLKRQVKYLLLPEVKIGREKMRPLNYIGDFEYTNKDGEWVVEDVKGYKGGEAFRMFMVKRKIFAFKYGIAIQVV